MVKSDVNAFNLNPLDYPGVRFQHFHDQATGMLCLTIASKTKGSDTIAFAGAIVSRKDKPNKQIGKQLALSRLLYDSERTMEMDISEFKCLVASRRIIGLFDHPDCYRLRERRINNILAGR